MLLCATMYTVIDLEHSQYNWQILFLQHFDHTLVIFFSCQLYYMSKIITTYTAHSGYKDIMKHHACSMCSSFSYEYTGLTCGGSIYPHIETLKNSIGI